jgi:hypothetical protein
MDPHPTLSLKGRERALIQVLSYERARIQINTMIRQSVTPMAIQAGGRAGASSSEM